MVREVTDQEILDAKAQVGAGGLGCEPASAASVAGAKLLVVARSDRPRRTRGLHPHRPSAERPDRHGGLSHDRSGQFNQVLGSRGVKRAAFANRAVAVTNDLDEIIKAIQLYS